MNRSSAFKRSPDDEATFGKWRRGVPMFYGSVGLALAAVMTVAHFARVAMEFANR
jgi:hypothetical protein